LYLHLAKLPWPARLLPEMSNPAGVPRFLQPVAMGVLLGQGWHIYSEVLARDSVVGLALCSAGVLLGLGGAIAVSTRADGRQAGLRLSLFWMSCTLNGGLSAIAQLRMRLGRSHARDDALVVNSCLSSGLLGASLPHVMMGVAHQPEPEVLMPMILAILITETICSSDAYPLMQVGISTFLFAVGLQGIATDANSPRFVRRGDTGSSRRGEKAGSSSAALLEPFFPATLLDASRYSPHFLVSQRAKCVPRGVTMEPLVSMVARQAAAEPARGGKGKERAPGTRRHRGDELLGAAAPQALSGGQSTMAVTTGPVGARPASGASVSRTAPSAEEAFRQAHATGTADVGSDIRWDVIFEEMRRVDGNKAERDAEVTPLGEVQASTAGGEARPRDNRAKGTQADAPVEVFAELTGDGDYDGDGFDDDDGDRDGYDYDCNRGHNGDYNGDGDGETGDGERVCTRDWQDDIPHTDANPKLPAGESLRNGNRAPQILTSRPAFEEFEDGDWPGEFSRKRLHCINLGSSGPTPPPTTHFDSDGEAPRDNVGLQTNCVLSAAAQEFVPVHSDNAGTHSNVNEVGAPIASELVDMSVDELDAIKNQPRARLRATAEAYRPAMQNPYAGAEEVGFQTTEMWTDSMWAEGQQHDWGISAPEVNPGAAIDPGLNRSDKGYGDYSYGNDAWSGYMYGASAGPWNEYGAYGGGHTLADHGYGFEAAKGLMGHLSPNAAEFVPGGNQIHSAAEEETQESHQEQPELEPVASLLDPDMPDPGPGRASAVRGVGGVDSDKQGKASTKDALQPTSRVLQVSDVEPWMDEGYISQLFSSMALVTSCKIFHNRGSAHVELASANAAVGVLETLCGGPIVAKDGQQLRVRWAKPEQVHDRECQNAYGASEARADDRSSNSKSKETNKGGVLRIPPGESSKSLWGSSGSKGGSKSSTMSRQMGNSTADSPTDKVTWAYIDPHDQVQVGFTNEQMRQWHDLGYFDGTLSIALVKNNSKRSKEPPRREFYPLRQWFPDASKSFTYIPKF